MALHNEHCHCEHLQATPTCFSLSGLQLGQFIFYFNLKERRGLHYSAW